MGIKKTRLLCLNIGLYTSKSRGYTVKPVNRCCSLLSLCKTPSIGVNSHHFGRTHINCGCDPSCFSPLSKPWQTHQPCPFQLGEPSLWGHTHLQAIAPVEVVLLWPGFQRFSFQKWNPRTPDLLDQSQQGTTSETYVQLLVLMST
jgi:hypothetical protein